MSHSSEIKAETPEEADLIDTLKRAGVLFHEVRRDPDQGLLITVAAAPKDADPWSAGRPCLIY